MTRGTDLQQLVDELVETCAWGDEARARALVSRLGTQPRKAKTLLEAMLKAPDAQVRQAAAFALGELGGTASVRLLEQQLALEETRDAHDGESVVEAITQALGRIKESGARATLLRRLERMSAGKPELGDVNTMARALWRRRHPDLLPSVRHALEQLAPLSMNSLRGVLLLLEKSPEELRAWVRAPSVPVEHKTEVLTVLDEELPDELLPLIPSLVSVASTLADTAVKQQGAAAYYCERLLLLLLSHKERIFSALPTEARSEMHAVARKLVASVAPNCAGRATLLLRAIGQPEDAALIEAHRPADPMLARSFDEAAQALRTLRH
jgi:uncharacterized protein YjeT (DUF2065 family)